MNTVQLPDLGGLLNTGVTSLIPGQGVDVYTCFLCCPLKVRSRVDRNKLVLSGIYKT